MLPRPLEFFLKQPIRNIQFLSVCKCCFAEMNVKLSAIQSCFIVTTSSSTASSKKLFCSNNQLFNQTKKFFFFFKGQHKLESNVCFTSPKLLKMAAQRSMVLTNLICSKLQSLKNLAYLLSEVKLKFTFLLQTWTDSQQESHSLITILHLKQHHLHSFSSNNFLILFLTLFLSLSPSLSFSVFLF